MYHGLKVKSSSYRGWMTDNQVVVVAQCLFYFTHLVSRAIDGFMWNYSMNKKRKLTNNKAKKEKNQKPKKSKKENRQTNKGSKQTNMQENWLKASTTPTPTLMVHGFDHVKWYFQCNQWCIDRPMLVKTWSGRNLVVRTSKQERYNNEDNQTSCWILPKGHKWVQVHDE